MGLDLSCNGNHFRFGSYSLVHCHRAAWIRALSAYYKFEKHNNQLSGRLKNCLYPNDPHNINYKNFCRHVVQDLVEDTDGPGLGASVFINHSDCEGVWSPEDARNILHALEWLTPFLKEDRELERLGAFEENEEEYFLVPCLEMSCNWNCDIYFH